MSFFDFIESVIEKLDGRVTCLVLFNQQPSQIDHHRYHHELPALAYVPQHPTVTNLHYHKTDKQRWRR